MTQAGVQPADEREFVGYFAAAQAMMAGVVASVGAIATAATMAAATRRITEIGSALQAQVVLWANRVLPRLYVRGAGGADLSLPEHTVSLESLAQQLIDDVARATQSMESDAKRQLRQIAQRSVMKSLAGETEQAQNLAARMQEHGIRFVDRAGRRWDAEVYARMLLSTHLVSIENAAALNAAAEAKSAGVRVYDGHGPQTDEPCKKAHGQAWSLAYAASRLLEHPNCQRRFRPLPAGWSGKLDREVDK